jgi:hypothetical protein
VWSNRYPKQWVDDYNRKVPAMVASLAQRGLKRDTKVVQYSSICPMTDFFILIGGEPSSTKREASMKQEMTSL